MNLTFGCRKSTSGFVGEYRGTYKATGRSMKPAFAGVYRVRAGRIVSFHQYTDTVKIAEATQPLA